MISRAAEEQVEVAIVGAGAAGLATAIFAARRLGAGRVVVFDGARRPGAKILISGGSRCNVTNVRVSERDFWGGSPAVVRRVLRSFSSADAVDFFRELGVALREEEDGKLFPASNRSRTVLEALLRALERAGAELRAGRRVLSLARADGGFVLGTEAGPVQARRVVLATGGLSLPKTGSDGTGYRLAASLGHSLVATSPALAPLVLDGSFHAALKGVPVDAELALRSPGRAPVRLRGPLLFTHFGVSGPVALNLARHWHRAALEGRPGAVVAGFLPGGGFAEAEAALLALALARPRAGLQSALASLLPASLAAALVEGLGLDGGCQLAQLPREARRAAAHALAEWPLAVRDSRGYGFAEATAGGIPLEEIDPATLESRRCPGLQLVGEMLDVDGRIGGFNFQWAWSSAFVAARGLARREPPASRLTSPRESQDDPLS